MTSAHLKPILVPAAIYAAALAIGLICRSIVRLPWFGEPVAGIVLMIGVLLALGAIVLAVLAIRSRAASHAASQLVTTGPYALSRNPFCLAGAAFVFATGLFTENPWLLVLSVAAASVVNFVTVVPEERALRQRYGKRHADYARKVRRWI